MVQNAGIPYGGNDRSDSSSEDSDDHLGEMRPFGKIPLRKLKTALPENLNMKCNPSELLEDFFDDPLEHPLTLVNTFQKYKSEMVKPLGGLKPLIKKSDAGVKPHETSKKEEEDEPKKVFYLALTISQIKLQPTKPEVKFNTEVKSNTAALKQPSEKIMKNDEPKVEAKKPDNIAAKSLFTSPKVPDQAAKDVKIDKTPIKATEEVKKQETAPVEIKQQPAKKIEPVGIIENTKTANKDEPDDIEKPKGGFSSSSPFGTRFRTGDDSMQSLPSAAFGKSSLSFGTTAQHNPKENIFGSERKFGSSSQDNSASSGGKIFN